MQRFRPIMPSPNETVFPLIGQLGQICPTTHADLETPLERDPGNDTQSFAGCNPFTKPLLAPEPLTKDEWPALESVSPGHSWPSPRQAVQVEIFKFQ